MSRIERPAPPPELDDNPEWTAETNARARRGAPWLWAGETVRVLRGSARALRAEADRLDVEADSIEAMGQG